MAELAASRTREGGTEEEVDAAGTLTRVSCPLFFFWNLCMVFPSPFGANAAPDFL
jgi:hypothetical protein